MRNVLRTALGVDGARGDQAPDFVVPSHVGLGYGSWAPVATGGDAKKRGKVPDEWRDAWLAALAAQAMPAGYARAFRRWHESFSPADRLAVFELDARLLLGHGNPSATEVGLTVHHTWGVPFLPGSAIKGLLAHYVAATFGPDGPPAAPYKAVDSEAKVRARYQGPTFENRRIALGPGDVYRAIFGAPDADDDDDAREAGALAGAARGYIVFHDALCLPPGGELKKGPAGVTLVEGPEAPAGEGDERDGRSGRDRDPPFRPDVLTVHQKGYYRSEGKKTSSSESASAEPSWPNDYDSPNPVGFLTARPGLRFLLALSGPADWLRLVEPWLAFALSEWGIGGKTAAGYGRGKVGAPLRGRQGEPDETVQWFHPPSPPKPASEALGAFDDYMKGLPPRAGGEAPWQCDVLQTIEREWLDRLCSLDAAERQKARAIIDRYIKPKKPAPRAMHEALCRRLLAGDSQPEGPR